MGYYISMELGGIIIPADKIEECLAAIEKLHTPENTKKNGGGGSYYKGVKTSHYSWVNYPKDGFKTLKDAFCEWRYCADFNDKGNFEVEYFDGEKLGDDEVLFAAIAPFIEDGVVTCFGEENEQWRYLFKNGVMTEQSGRIVWE